MPVVSIVSYEIGWNPKTKQGAVRIRLEGGQEYPVPIGSAEELTAVAMILEESQVSVNTDTGFIMTPNWKPV